MHSILSKHFYIIRSIPDCVEVKSKFHYWRIIRYEQDAYFLHHKYNIDDKYHKQINRPYTLKSIIRIINDHDTFVGNQNFHG